MNSINVFGITFVLLLFSACSSIPNAEPTSDLIETVTRPVDIVSEVEITPTATSTASSTATATKNPPTPTPSLTPRPTNPTTPTFTPTSTQPPSPAELTQEAVLKLTPSPTATPTLPAAVPLPSAPSAAIEVISQLGGSVRNLIVQGTHAYLAIGPRLVILDIANPSQPVFVAQSPVLDSIEAMVLTDTAAFVLTEKHDLHVFDIADPTDPKQSTVFHVEGADSFLNFNSGWRVVGMELFENEVYITIGDKNRTYLSIIDVTNPVHPIEVTSSQVPKRMKVLAVAENHIYMRHYTAVKDADLLVMDVTDFSNIVEVSRMQGTDVGFVQDMDIVGTTAYLASGKGLAFGKSGLRIIDLTNPAKPEIIDHYYVEGMESIYQVAVAGDHAYVSADPRYAGTLRLFYNSVSPPMSSGKLEAIDISNPTVPRTVGTYETSGGIWGLQADEGLVYIASDDFVVVDAQKPDSLMTIGSYPLMVEALDVVVNGATAYLATGNQGLYTVNVSQPTSPMITSRSNQEAGHALYVAVSEDAVYLTNNWQVGRRPDPTKPEIDVRVFDASNPANPVEVDPYNVLAESDDPLSDIKAVDNYLYTLCFVPGYLSIIDRNDPEPVAKASIVEFPATSYSEIAIVENYAYVTGRSDLLHIMDVIDPMIPITVSLGIEGRDAIAAAYLDRSIASAGVIAVA